MKPKTTKKLREEANKLLRASGFQKNGGRRGETSYKQLLFEKSLILTPVGGKPKH